jgi:hypothetical protein
VSYLGGEGCGCPGTGPLHGIAACAVHPEGVVCLECHRTTRVAWWTGARHLCRQCFRALSDREAEGGGEVR